MVIVDESLESAEQQNIENERNPSTNVDKNGTERQNG